MNINTKNLVREELVFSLYKKKTFKDSILIQYKRYRHILLEAIKYLKKVIEGVIITIDELYRKNKDNLQKKCEICILNSNIRQISRIFILKLI